MTKPITRPTKTRKVPAKALCFAGDMAVDETAALDSATTPAAGSESETPPPPVPITIRARTSGIANQGYWGQCVHDMAGYIPPAGPIAINYNHDRCQLIGSIPTAPAVVDGELVAQGQLVPFEDDDVASEVIYKGAKGVPYQASIQLDLATLVIEEIEPNLSVEVNGQTFIGPLVIFRQWGIEAISIVPFGADADTSVEFARGGEFSIRCFSSSEGPPTMADTASKQLGCGDFAEWAKKTFGMDVATMTDEQLPLFQAAFAAEAPAEDPPKDPPADPPADKTAEKPAGDTTDTNKTDLGRPEAQRMLADFGSDGAVWFAEGKTYEQAASLFRTQQADRIKTLEAEKADLAKKADFRRGHPTPAAFVPPVDENAKPPMADFTGHSDARRKVIAAITSRLPKTSNN